MKLTPKQQESLLCKLNELFEGGNYYLLLREEYGKWHRLTNLNKRPDEEKLELTEVIKSIFNI